MYIKIDPSAKGLAEEIKRVCPDCKIKDAKNDVKLGISRVQKLLIYKRLFFSSSLNINRCIIRNITEYVERRDLSICL